MKKYFFILLALAVFGFLAFQIKQGIGPLYSVDKPSVVVGKHIFKVEIADELLEHRLGLSGRELLESNHGMLFVFPDKQVRSFWMKNMEFPIDIVWIEDDQVVKIDRDLPPEGAVPAKHYTSGIPVNYVLEINAGAAARYGVAAGDKVIFNLK